MLWFTLCRASAYLELVDHAEGNGTPARLGVVHLPLNHERLNAGLRKGLGRAPASRATANHCRKKPCHGQRKPSNVRQRHSARVLCGRRRLNQVRKPVRGNCSPLPHMVQNHDNPAGFPSLRFLLVRLALKWDVAWPRGKPLIRAALPGASAVNQRHPEGNKIRVPLGAPGTWEYRPRAKGQTPGDSAVGRGPATHLQL